MKGNFEHGLLQDNARWLDFFFRIVDLGFIYLSAHLCYYFNFSSWIINTNYSVAIAFGLIIASILFSLGSLYQPWRGKSLIEEFKTVLGSFLLLAMALSFLALLTKTGSSYSRLYCLQWFSLAISLVVLSRLIVRSTFRSLRRQGYNRRKVVIVGGGILGQRVYSTLSNADWTGLEIVGYFDEKPDKHILCPRLGNLDQIEAYLDENYIDQVWMAFPLEGMKLIQKVVHQLRHSTTEVKFIPDISDFKLLNQSVSNFAGLPVLNLSSSPMTGDKRLLKKIEDVLLASIILILISPVMLLIAIGIKLTSPGPVIFRQQRHGYNGRKVEVWKFRSMKMHAEKDGKVTQASKKDPRITPFGAFLRRSSLDELPQFINVLQGRMSIVGPRPHAVAHNEMYKNQIDGYMLRHKVKPGITGWAQINGWRGETDTPEKMENRVRCDMDYIRNWSLFLDLKIVFLTIFKGFFDKNAY